MNTKTFLAVVVALLIGAVAGYMLAPGKAVAPQGAHMMPDGSIMTDAGEDDMHGAMGDMMAGLEGKTGDEFDKAFLSEMIVHHEGAVAMADAVLHHAKHEELKTMARAIISAQTAEIEQMKQWLSEWYAQ